MVPCSSLIHSFTYLIDTFFFRFTIIYFSDLYGFKEVHIELPLATIPYTNVKQTFRENHCFMSKLGKRFPHLYPTSPLVPAMPSSGWAATALVSAIYIYGTGTARSIERAEMEI